MVKLIGMVLIVISTTVLGLGKSAGLKKRVSELQNIQTALNLLKSEIAFSRNNLKTAFLNIAESSKSAELFRYAAESVEEARIKQAWRCSVDKFYEISHIKKEDAEIIKLLGGELGMSDKENQIKNIDYVSELLGLKIAEANEEYLKTAGMYRSVGVLAGLFLAIVLI